MTLEKIRSKPLFSFSIYMLVGVFTSLILWCRGPKMFGDHAYTFYNNYIIFRNSFLHLISGQNMYIHYLDVQWDLYKYSPSFAVWMAPFSLLPDIVGLSVWNLINTLAIYTGFYLIGLQKRQALFFATLFVFQELYVSVMNSQSNALIAGLLIASLGLWEKSKPALAILCISIATFIKPFAIVFFLIWFFYDKKWQNIIISVVIFALLLILPMLVVGMKEGVNTYLEWFALLKQDHDVSFGISVMGVLNLMFDAVLYKDIIIVASGFIILLPLLRIRQYAYLDFKIHYITFLLIWMVIFNHKAESPTYIIAISGIALWLFSSKRNRLEWILGILALVFTQFSTSDLFPFIVRNEIFTPFHVKAWPCIGIWVYILTKLLMHNFEINQDINLMNTYAVANRSTES